MTRHLTVGIVGHGRAVQRAAGAIRRLGLAVTGVADLPWDPESPLVEAGVRDTARALSTTPYDSIDTLLADVDVVHLASAPSRRRRDAVTAFGRRIPVICEAPLAVDTNEAWRLAREAARTGIVNATVLPARRLPWMIAVTQHLPPATLGAPRLVEVRLTRREVVPELEQRPAGVPRDAGGLIPLAAELATALDVVEVGAGQPIVEVAARIDGESSGGSRHREAVCLVTLANGALGTVVVTLGGQAIADRTEMRAQFEHGEWAGRSGALELSLSAAARRSIPVLPQLNSQAPPDEVAVAAAALEPVYADIRTGAPSSATAYPTFVAGYRSARLIAAVAASAEHGRTERLD